MQFKNGNTYEGNWQNGLMHGTGFFKWNDTGASYNGILLTYAGQYQKGKKHGTGNFKYADGR
jgi:hypothetical protein